MEAFRTIILRHGESTGSILPLRLQLGPCSVGIGNDIRLLRDIEADIGYIGSGMHHRSCRIF